MASRDSKGASSSLLPTGEMWTIGSVDVWWFLCRRAVPEGPP